MPQEVLSREAADPGTPPPETAKALNMLYAPIKKSEPVPDRAPPVSDPAVMPAPPAAIIKQADLVSESERRLLNRMKDSNSFLTIRVNGVELTLDIVDVDRTETSICCIVKQNGLRCKIPRSQSVEIELEGTVYHTAFLGSWHTLEWLGAHVVVFPVIPDGEEG